jgi:hypothetical protein
MAGRRCHLQLTKTRKTPKLSGEFLVYMQMAQQLGWQKGTVLFDNGYGGHYPNHLATSDASVQYVMCST